MIDLQWLAQNFNDDLTIFDIGSAGLHSTSVPFKSFFPKSKIYSFECNDFWISGTDSNFNIARDFDINYFHLAFFDSDGTKKMFFPSDIHQGSFDPYSGSFFKPNGDHKIYHRGRLIETMRVDTFCKKFNVSPDFIHIDTEGSEFYILKCLGEYKPKAIWTEIHGFQAYKCGITFDIFNNMLNGQGYDFIGGTDADGLYLLRGESFTKYNFEGHRE